jgi:hypothetical protein
LRNTWSSRRGPDELIALTKAGILELGILIHYKVSVATNSKISS